MHSHHSNFPETNLSLAAYPGMDLHRVLACAAGSSPAEPAIGTLALTHTQLCPQNRGLLTDEYAQALQQQFPAIQLRLHANVQVLPSRRVADWTSWRYDQCYWHTLARISRILVAPAYIAHAGRRKDGTFADVVAAVRAAEDLFQCPVGVEGHFPTRQGEFLISSWEEYRQLFDSGIRYALDLSHMHILATQSSRIDIALMQDMLASDRCIEVHVSGNDGASDCHEMLADRPWWWTLLPYVGAEAVVFSEGNQLARNPLLQSTDFVQNTVDNMKKPS
jgi:hypothetical protein